MDIALIIRIITIVCFLILSIQIFRRYHNYPEQPIRIIFYVTILGIISVAIEMIFVSPEVFDQLLFLEYLLVYGVFRLVFAYSLLFYLEFHENDRPSSISLIFATASIFSSGTYLIGVIYFLRSGYIIPNQPSEYLPFVAVPIGIGLLYPTFRIITYGYRYMSETVNTTQRKQLLLFVIGAVFWFGFPNFLLSISALNFQRDPVLTSFALNIGLPFIMLIGIILVIFSFALSNQVIIPGIKFVDNLIVINQGGIPLYSYKFVASNTQDALLSGGISAITSLLREAIGIESNVRKITFDEKEVLIHSRGDLGFILITENSTSYLNHALQRFGAVYTSEIGDNTSGRVDDEEIITKLLIDSFGLFGGIES